eukprot:scaffold20020_cov120-Skeletonema_dohrnii-CCMP3373.AAC.1
MKRKCPKVGCRGKVKQWPCVTLGLRAPARSKKMEGMFGKRQRDFASNPSRWQDNIWTSYRGDGVAFPNDLERSESERT